MKRPVKIIRLTMLSLIFLVTGIWGCGDTTWYCGSKANPHAVRATLRNDTLVISGKGEMGLYQMVGSLSPWHNVKDRVTTVIIEDGVTHIGVYAFYNHTNLKLITIPNSVRSIGFGAFEDSGLMFISVGDDHPVYSSVDGVLFNKIQDTLLLYPSSKQGAYTIPNSVTSIGGAFQGSTGLTSVILPDGLTFIGEISFSGCTRLTAINVSDSHPTYSSVDGVLCNKAKDTLLQYPSGRQGAYTIPGSVTVIRHFAFANNLGLTSITITGNVSTIGSQAFFRCYNLTSVTIEEGVISIEEQAFRGCTHLTSLTIPSSMRSIRLGAFTDCIRLTSITSLNLDPNDAPIDSYFGYVIHGGVACLYVPANSIDAYSVHDEWGKRFRCIKAIAEAGD